MFKRFGLPALVLGTVIGVLSPVGLLAQDHRGGDRGNSGGHGWGGGQNYSGRGYNGGGRNYNRGGPPKKRGGGKFFKRGGVSGPGFFCGGGRDPREKFF